MLASGAHVSIDGIEYVLARDQDGRLLIRESFETLFANTSAIAGELAAQQIRPNRIYWSITDWSGGEGATVYYPQNPTQYDVALGMNVTKRGQLTTRTKRRRSAVARAGANATADERPSGGSAHTHAVIAWEDNIVVSSDAITWSAAQDITPVGSGVSYTQAISDGVSVAFYPDVVNEIPAVSPGTSTTTWADVQTSTTPDPPLVGCFLDAATYSLGSDGTGLLGIYKGDGTAGVGTAQNWGNNLIFSTGVTPSGTWGTDFWTSAVATETAAYFSFSTRTHAFVWEIRNDIGRPFFSGSPGQAVKLLLYKSGVLFLLGNTHAAGSTFANIDMIPLATGQVLEGLIEPRRHQNTSLSTFDVGCPANGAYIFAADRSTGKIFLYDIRNDALSLFDDLVNMGTGDGVDFVSGEDNIAFLAMHGARLFGATYNTADSGVTSLQVISWDDFEVQNRDNSQAISSNLETAAWDMGLPMETKALMGFHVVYKVTDAATTSGLVANSRITISYSLDDAAYSTTVASGASATITSATTPSSGIKGRHFIQVSDGTTTQKFTRMKVKITLDNNSQAVAPPIVYSVVAETRPMAFERTWDLVIQAEDEESNERPTSRQHTGKYIRDQLATLATQKEVVTFVDGSWDDAPNSTSSYTVVVEDPTPELSDTLAQGQVAIRLRAIV